MKELLNRKLTDLSEIEKEMLLKSGYDIVIEDDYIYIDFDFDLGVTIKIRNKNLILEEW